MARRLASTCRPAWRPTPSISTRTTPPPWCYRWSISTITQLRETLDDPDRGEDSDARRRGPGLYVHARRPGTVAGGDLLHGRPGDPPGPVPDVRAPGLT